MKKQTSIEWVIVGLGNKGIEHKYNRHNIGFSCIDLLSKNHNIEMNIIQFNAQIGIGNIGNHSCMLMKPLTYMNNCGIAVLECLKKNNIPPHRLLIVFDDIYFSPGKMRICRKGSSGGHKGINSVIEHLCTSDFPRIRIGVGRPGEDCSLEKWVVSDMTNDEISATNKALEKACIAVELILNNKIDDAMLKFN